MRGKVFVREETIVGKISAGERRIWGESSVEGKGSRSGHDDGGSSERMVLIM